MTRDRLFAALFGGILIGMVASWACGPLVPDANAQSGGGAAACSEWEVRGFNWSQPSEAPITIGEGFEPIAYDLGLVAARRCLD